CAPSPVTPRRSIPASAGPSGSIPAPARWRGSGVRPTSTSSPARAGPGRAGSRPGCSRSGPADCRGPRSEAESRERQVADGIARRDGPFRIGKLHEPLGPGEAGDPARAFRAEHLDPSLVIEPGAQILAPPVFLALRE